MQVRRKFKKIEARRLLNKDEIPDERELKKWLADMNDKGYCVLKNSVTIRRVSQFPSSFAMWGWFVYVGKRRAKTSMFMYDKEKNIFTSLIDGISCAHFNAVSQEGKEVLQGKLRLEELGVQYIGW